MNKLRWLLWTAAVVAAFGITFLSFVSGRNLESTPSDEPAMLDYTNRLESYCPVHRIPMGVGKVPVAYGLPVMGEAGAVRAVLFPNSRANKQAGCGVLPATHAWVHICPDCQRAENAWKLAQQKPR